MAVCYLERRQLWRYIQLVAYLMHGPAGHWWPLDGSIFAVAITVMFGLGQRYRLRRCAG